MKISGHSACERVRARIEAVCDGSLAPLEQARDEGHLEACAACAAIASEHEAWLRDVRAHLAPSLADVGAARAGLDERLATARGPHTIAVAAWFRAAAVAAAAVVAFSLLDSSGAVDVPLGSLLASARRVGADALSGPAWPAVLDPLDSFER